MKLEYVPENVENFIQKLWVDDKIFQFVDLNAPNKYYCLSMFPYPSGKLHIGHVRNYTIGDIISGYARLKGFNVLNTIGWDSFGMPAENAAYKNNISPENWTFNNIFTMRKQLKRLSFSFDWSKEITTSNPNYYKWEQLFFIKLYHSGLVYKKNGFVNWDPVDKTVLANEQVINGRGWRSNALVKRIKIQQWYIKITDYSNELLYDLSLLSGWPEKVKEMQRNWIGKSIKFEIQIYLKSINDFFKIHLDNILDIFLLKKVFIFKYNLLTNLNVDFLNPFNKRKIFIKFKKNIDNDEPFCLSLYDKSFLVKFLNFIFSDIKFSFLEKIMFKLFFLKKNIKKIEIFKLQDWCISRQRYWGAPIPFINCKKCGIVHENENNLPVILPKVKNSKYSKISLKTFKSFYIVKCYSCNENAFRETDTFDTFFESSWYYLKYLSSSFINFKNISSWLPVDQYIGGIEHATMHLIYARFFHKVMKDFNIVSNNEPFKNLLTQGMVLMGGSKMSKSKGNIPDQEFLIRLYGSDTLRLFIIFSAPADQSFEWTDNGISGCKKFIDKIWNYSYFLKSKIFFDNFDEYNFHFCDKSYDNIFKFNFYLDSISDILKNNLSFNVLISFLMKMFKLLEVFLNDSLEKLYLNNKIFKSLLIILFPITPCVVYFIWTYILKERSSLFDQKFPEKFRNIHVDKTYINISVLINNKFKFKIFFDNSLFTIVNKVDILNHSDVKKYICEKNIKKIVYKENKVINIII